MAIWLAASSAGCLDLEGPSWDPPTVIGLEPVGGLVGEREPVRVLFSAPVSPIDAWPVEVVDAEGRGMAAQLEATAPAQRITLSPLPAWPHDTLLYVRLRDGLVDELGQPLVSVPALRFMARTKTSSLGIALRSPRAGSLVPMNLRALVLEHSTPDPEVRRVELESERGRAVAIVTERRGSLIRAELPSYEGECAPLCPGTAYRARIPGTEAPEIWINTATVVDLDAPEVIQSEARVDGDRFVISVRASEPVRLGGAVMSDTGERVDLSDRILPAVDHRLETISPLLPDMGYSVVVEGEDAFGNRLPAQTWRLWTPPEVQIEISELVPTPLRDWGDSASAGWPFDAEPGGGAVSDADEWIELVNRSAAPLDLSSAGIVVRVIDATPSETRLDAAPGSYFGDGGSPGAWWPGEALVVRLRGTMPSRDFAIEVTSGGRLLDRISIGRRSEAEHVGGRPPDLDHEAIAKDAAGVYRWCRPTPGDPSPAVDCL